MRQIFWSFYLGDAQIILGTVWLRSLGLIIWYFSNHILKYWKGGSPITLKGVRAGPVEMIEGESLDRILNKELLHLLYRRTQLKISEEESLIQKWSYYWKSFKMYFRYHKSYFLLDSVIIIYRY